MPPRRTGATAATAGVVLAVVTQVWPLLALLATLTSAAVVWWAASGDPVPAQMFARLVGVTVVGLVGSFALHELAHLAALRRIPSVHGVRLERTGWRLSLHPQGRMSPRQVVGVAVAGPAACLLVGLTWWAVAPTSTLRWWYLAHVLALTPLMGDGRAVMTAIRAARRSEPSTTRRP